MLPNFLVVGAGRSGTTSLHHYLRQHPEIYLPAVKSPSYFYCHHLSLPSQGEPNPVMQDYFVSATAEYEALFDGVKGESAIGEVSPAYLASMRAIDHIAVKIPAARIVIILRNPVERFYSRYVARRRDGLEALPTVEALIEQERTRPLISDEAVGTYLSAGFCSHFVAAYMKRFTQERVHLTLFDDLDEDASAYMRRLFSFLRVSPDFKTDVSKRENTSRGYIRNPILRTAWTKSAMVRQAIRPYLPKTSRDLVFRRVTHHVRAQPMEPDTRRELAEIYRPEIEKLQTLTGRDLTHWLH